MCFKIGPALREYFHYRVYPWSLSYEDMVRPGLSLPGPIDRNDIRKRILWTIRIQTLIRIRSEPQI
jgi:hypothetical protein